MADITIMAYLIVFGSYLHIVILSNNRHVLTTLNSYIWIFWESESTTLCIHCLHKVGRVHSDSHLCSCLPSGAANHHSQSTLRPPLPPPHNHHNLSHQSANSLNRNTLRGGRNPIHAPAPGTGDGPTTPESVQLQDSWVLNSNVPLETR